MLGLQIFLGKSPSRERSVATESLPDLSFRCTSVEIAQRLPETWRFCEQRINDLLTASYTG